MTTFRTILAQVAAAHELAVEDITGRLVRKHLHAARVEVVTRARAETALSTTRIGQLMGGRDHTAVLNMLQPINRAVVPSKAAKERLRVEDFEVLATLGPELAEALRADRRARRIFSQYQLRALFEAARRQGARA